MHLLLIACRNGCHGAAMEGIFEGDQFVFMIVADRLVIGARSLYRAFDSLGAGIGEKDGVSEGGIHQALRKRLALRAAIQVRHMHQRRCLFLDRLGQVRMAMAQEVDCNAAGEIKRAAAVFGNEPGTFASHRPEPATGIDGHQGGDRHGWVLSV